jgi:hypothetical protein
MNTELKNKKLIEPIKVRVEWTDETFDFVKSYPFPSICFFSVSGSSAGHFCNKSLVFHPLILTFASTYRERPRDGPYDVLATCNQGANSPLGYAKNR